MHGAAAHSGHAADYGAAGAQPLRKVPQGNQGKMSLSGILALIAGPAAVFAWTCWVRCWKIHHISNQLSWAIELIVFLFICVLCCAPAWDFSTSNGRMWTFVLLTSLYAWLAGVLYGEYEWGEHFKPYYDINALNTYPGVEVNYFPGQTLMDAGIVEFVPGTRLNLSLSYGFKNDDTYCVAPIVPAHTAGEAKMTDGFKVSALPDTVYRNSSDFSNGSNQVKWGKDFEGKGNGPNYDFWAVGLNCCSGHAPDFQCGEFDNQRAHSALRLMRDDLRGYFKLAVEEATAAYNIQAVHPIFLYWMETPEVEVQNYLDEGEQAFFSGVGAYIVFQSLLTVAAITQFIFKAPY